MIATLRGEISQIEDTALIVEVGGVGLRVFVPAPLRGQVKAGEAVFLFTHLVVREDALILYGFESQGDRELFNILLGVDGVGPKVALSVLSTMTIGCHSTRSLRRRTRCIEPRARRWQKDRAKNGASSQR